MSLKGIGSCRLSWDSLNTILSPAGKEIMFLYGRKGLVAAVSGGQVRRDLSSDTLCGLNLAVPGAGFARPRVLVIGVKVEAKANSEQKKCLMWVVWVAPRGARLKILEVLDFKLFRSCL